MGRPQKRWMAYFMENAMKMDDWGYPYDSGNPHIAGFIPMIL